MTALIIILMLIWLVIIQYKLTELSDAIKDIKGKLTKKDIYGQPSIIKGATETNPQNIESISEIPDELFYQSEEKTIPQFIENNLKKENKSESFENIFLGNIFNKIGAFAILVALVILIKMISPFFVFTAQLKITLGYLSGIAMMIGALKLYNKENLRNYSEVLLGTGFGAMFISTYCASGIFHLFNLPVTFIIATAFLLLAFYFADKLKTVSMLVISLIAGYLNIIFLNSEFIISDNFLFGYLIFINLTSILYTYRNPSKDIVNLINLPITMLAALIYCSEIQIIFPLTLWGLYIAYDIIKPDSEVKNQLLSYINITVFSIILIKVFHSDYHRIAYAELGITLIYAIIAYYKNSNIDNLKNYINLSLVTSTLFTYFMCDKSPTTKCFAWSIETAVLAFYSYKYKLRFLGAWAIGLFAAAYCAIIPIDGVLAVKSIGKYTPIWNIRLLMFTPIILSSAFSYYLLKKTDEAKLISFSEFFKFISITSIYLYIGLELNNIITQRFIGENTSAVFINEMTNVILAFAYTINLKKLYYATSSNSFISIIAGFFGICAALCLLITGIHYIPIKAFIPVINIRTVAFLTGIGTSILYEKWTKNKIYKYLGIFLGFILLHYEINDIINKYSINEGQYLISICWIVYAGIITTIGILKNRDYLKNSGIGLCILSILKILIYDLSNIDILYKFIAIITLGIILMILSYMYNKKYTK